MAKKTKKNLKSLDETGRRTKKVADRRQVEVPISGNRRKVQRRRQIDPTTCERDYNDSEIEFMQALDEYKRTSGRMFPTCSEILEVLMKLGYCKSEMPASSCCQSTETIEQVESEMHELDELESLG